MTTCMYFLHLRCRLSGKKKKIIVIGELVRGEIWAIIQVEEADQIKKKNPTKTIKIVHSVTILIALRSIPGIKCNTVCITFIIVTNNLGFKQLSRL